MPAQRERIPRARLIASVIVTILLGLQVWATDAWSVRGNPAFLAHGEPLPTSFHSFGAPSPHSLLPAMNAVVPSSLTPLATSHLDATPRRTVEIPIAGIRRAALYGVYVGGYAAAARIGTRLGMDHEYRIRRLETAYAYDLFAHAYTTQQLGLVLSSYNRWMGLPETRSRKLGVWWGAFGMLTFMEVFNGFMPGVRFDPLDVAANFAGAWLADGGLDVAERHPALGHLSLQFGPKSVDRMFANENSQGLVENVWHDYPNGRFGIGYDLTWNKRRWLTLLATYEITSWDVRVMKNRFGLGVEFPVITWLTPWLRRVPGGRPVTAAYEWLDRRLIMPFLFVQLFSIDADPWSHRQPFQE